MNTTQRPIAKALQQGLDLLRLMRNGEARSLEHLAIASGLAKSSCLRLLDTLCAEGLAERDPDTKAYRAVMQLTPLMLGRSREREIMHRLAALSKASGLTAEWWTVTAQGMQLTFRHAPPDKELLIHARIGFTYPRNKLEIIPAFEHAHVLKDQFPKNTIMWDERCLEKKAKVADCKALMQVAKIGRAADLHMNGVGVRRIAGLIGRECLAIAIPPMPAVDDIEATYGSLFDEHYYALAAIMEDEE